MAECVSLAVGRLQALDIKLGERLPPGLLYIFVVLTLALFRASHTRLWSNISLKNGTS